MQRINNNEDPVWYLTSNVKESDLIEFIESQTKTTAR